MTGYPLRQKDRSVASEGSCTLLSVSDAYITDTATGEQFTLRSQIGADVYALLEKLRM